MNGQSRYPYPSELASLPRDRPAVIEASAGTGKTYLIEHLVVDRLVAGDARIDEMLVVTFTERAAAELVRRIGSLIRDVLRYQPTADDAAVPHAWNIDTAARDRLEAALRGLDVAPISTIHAFCQRVLTEHAFASGRLLSQSQVESRTAFTAAFDEVIRGRLAEDLHSMLAAWLGTDRDVGAMEALLYKARGLRCEWAMIYDPERIATEARAFADIKPENARAVTMRSIKRAGYVADRIDLLHGACTRFVAHGEPAWLLAEIDGFVKEKEIFDFILHPDRLGGARAKPGVAPLLERIEALAGIAPPLATAVAQRFGPIVEAALRARKRAAGLYDFDDMLELVDEALRGARGSELASALRKRYHLAVIDEFQDTDPVQWRIFRTIFLEAGDPRPLYLVGDPKQSIYGFRGADVSTYEDARGAVAALGRVQQLQRNFRSTPAVIDAYNAIFDQQAPHPFFSAGTGYHHPVTYGGKESEPVDRSRPLTLLRIKADDEEHLPMRLVRARLAEAIADEIVQLRNRSEVPNARAIFVLTRTRKESQTVADALAARAVPAVLAAQEGLYEAEEARHVRDLLAAIADPHDPAKRLRAWLTPFFELPLADLPAAAAGGDQALIDRLLGWNAAAESGDLSGLFGRILEESGVTRRELFAGDAMRRLTNFQQLFELLAIDAARAARPLEDVARRIAGLAARLVVPSPEEGNVLRAEGDRDAVQIMTMHAAKGLEADVVFVYGGFNPGPRDQVRSYVVGGHRVRLAGLPRLSQITELVTRDRDSEDQRLYYVALTRARKRLYLPYSGNVPEPDASPFDAPPREEYWKIAGGYKHVNRRIRELVNEPDPRRLRDPHEIVIDARDASAGDPVGAPAAIAAWRPEPEGVAPIENDPALAGLRRARAGAVTTSYSRIKQAHGGYHPPTEMLDEVASPADTHPDDGELSGGRAVGVFLHAVLEKLPLPSLLETPAFDAWGARPDVQSLVNGLLRQYGRGATELRPALRLAHAALTAGLPVVGGTLQGLAHATPTAREVEFLFPFPAGAGGPQRGYVKGFIDVVFEHEGRSYLGDWKTDRLPAWNAAAVAAHVENNYALQERFYGLALVRMLGITDAAAYEARFGGTLYIFVRGIAQSKDAIRSRRPTFDEITGWQRDLAVALEGGDGA